MEKITTIGLDIAKQVFQVHGVDNLKNLLPHWGSLTPQKYPNEVAVLDGHRGKKKLYPYRPSPILAARRSRRKRFAVQVPTIWSPT